MTGWLTVLLLAQALPQPPSFEPVFREAVARRLKEYGPRHVKYADSLVNLALYLQRQNPKSSEPERLLRQALGIAPAGSTRLAEISQHLGDLLASTGRDALPFYQRALAIREKRTPDEVEPLLTKIGDLNAEAGKPDQAELYYRRSIAILEKRSEPERLANAYNNLGIALEAQGKPGDAEGCYRKSAAAYERALGRNHPEVASVLLNQASLVLGRGDAAAAEPLVSRSLTILESTVGPQHPRFADACESMAAIGKATGDAGALSKHQRCSAAMRKASAPR
jgi:tetratricopeptide (TPR) repeat protein